MKCPFTSLLPNLDIICFISMMMLTIKRKQKNDRIVRHDFICLLNAEVFSALWINSSKKTVLLKMQLGAILCERKNNVDVYCPALYCFTIGFKLPTIMKWEMLLLKVIFSQSRIVKRLKCANSWLRKDWLVWRDDIGNCFQSVTISRVKGQEAPSLSSLFFHKSSPAP